MRIHRYPLKITDHQVVDLPLSSVPLSVAPGRHFSDLSRQDTPRPMDEHIDLWVQEPEQADKVQYHIHIVGTGNPMPHDESTRHVFLGTCVMPSGMVWHAFWSEA